MPVSNLPAVFSANHSLFTMVTRDQSSQAFEHHTLAVCCIRAILVFYHTRDLELFVVGPSCTHVGSETGHATQTHTNRKMLGRFCLSYVLTPHYLAPVNHKVT